MIKCQHNEEIKLFCIKNTCQHANVGGCEQCFLVDKSHTVGKDLIDIQQLHKLMSQYTFPKSVKPECVNLQDSFYTYFKKIQNEMKQIIVTIDQICKNVVNNIGFPYICFKNHFNVYKRIKNKQYSKISLTEFQKFIQESKQVNIQKLTEMEEKLYIKQVNNFHQMIKEIDHMMATFENLTKYYDQKTRFIHDPAPYLQNKEIVQKIKSHLKSNHAKNENHPQNISKSQKIKESQINSKMVSSGLHLNTLQNNELKRAKTSQAPTTIANQNGNKNLLAKIQTQTKDKLRGSFLMEPTKETRQRRVSIDNRLVSNRSKLENQVNKLKKGNATKDENDVENSGSEEVSKEKLKNINLPAGQQKVKNDKSELISVIPITRKLQSNLYNNQKIQQIDSPLVRKKMSSKSKKVKTQGLEANQSPTIIASPQPDQKGQQKFNDFKLQKPVNQLPLLSQSQEKSFVLLLASLKLPAAQAIPLVEKALQQSNKNLSAAQYLSFLYLDSNQFKKCLKICDFYLNMLGEKEDISPSRVLFLNNKSAALNGLGRYSQTVKILSVCSPLNEIGLKILGNAYYGLGFLDHAVSLYKKFLQENYDDQVYYNLSGCLYLIGQIEPAKIAIQTALASQPTNKVYLDLQSHIMNPK